MVDLIKNARGISEDKLCQIEIYFMPCLRK